MKRKEDHPQNAGQRGLTMADVVAGLLVLAIIAAVAVYRHASVDFDAFADAETLKGALRATRTRAMGDIVPWSFQTAGQTGTLSRAGVARESVTFKTGGVAAGTVTFDTRGAPAGTLSFAVARYSASPVVVTPQTGFVP
jgi:hypothetical protein